MSQNRKRPSRGATRKPQRQTPTWALVGVGFVAGCFVSFLVYLVSIGPSETSPEKPVASMPKPAPAKTDNKPQFDFFTLLPEREVIVPEQSEDNDQPQEQVQYILQAGSFKRANDADRRRAELLLLGMDAKVEAVEANGETWHRVYVGPFTSRSNLSRARQTLISEGIDTLLLKRKG